MDFSNMSFFSCRNCLTLRVRQLGLSQAAMRRWMRLRIKHRCRTCLIVALVAIFIVSSYIGYVIRRETCSNELSIEMLHNLCALYRSREVAGSLCHKLCETEDLQFDSCTNYRGGKTVLFMSCRGCEDPVKTVQVVFKMKEALDERDKLDLAILLPDRTEESIIQFEKMFTEMVKNSYWFKFSKDMSSAKDILTLTWGWDYRKFVEQNAGTLPREMVIAQAVQSIWSLSEQHEYLISKLLQNKTFIPNIYGTCGPAYVTEFTQSLGKYEYQFFSKTTQEWETRAFLAVKLIDLIKLLDSDLHETLNLCDLKSENFGLRNNWDVTLIDTDCALFDTDLSRQFNYSKCISNSDCDFFDCRGVCDTTAGKCLTQRANNNLQSLCEDVFQGLSGKFPTGLLRDPPLDIKVELYKILQDCVYPGTASGYHDVREEALSETGAKLRELLVHSIQNTDFVKMLNPGSG